MSSQVVLILHLRRALARSWLYAQDRSSKRFHAAPATAPGAPPMVVTAAARRDEERGIRRKTRAKVAEALAKASADAAARLAKAHVKAEKITGEEAAAAAAAKKKEADAAAAAAAAKEKEADAVLQRVQQREKELLEQQALAQRSSATPSPGGRRQPAPAKSKQQVRLTYHTTWSHTIVHA